MVNNDHGETPIGQPETPTSAEIPLAPDRDQLLLARRARQKGGSRHSTKGRLVMSAALLIAGAGGIFVLASPAQALRIFGFGKIDSAQKTSQIGLNVNSPVDKPPQLDFIVPAAPAVPHADPNAGLNDKIAALQKQIADLEQNKRPAMSSEDIQNLLKTSNDALAQKLEAEARKASEDRQRAEEEARLQADARNAQDQQNRTQRESKAVLLDNTEETNGPVEADGPGQTQDQNLAFLKSNASSVVQTSSSVRLADPSHMVVQGTIISAVLETAIDTTLPGTLRAQVMEPVYSFDGTNVMMPEGTILIGAFNNEVELAQSRVMIAWNRAITPEGKSIALGSIGTDLLGRSGTAGNVDNRYLTKFGAAALISAITAVPTMIASQNKSSANAGSSGTTLNVNGGSQVAGSVSSNVGDQANDILGKYLALAPIIRIPQGEEIRIFVNRDLVFR
jgi:type IV secretion system protein VirB10